MPESFQSVIERPGAVDLSQLALPAGEVGKIEDVSFRAVSGVWYKLSATEGTRLYNQGEVILGLHLEAATEVCSSAEIYEIPILALNAMKNWFIERRHFHKNGNVIVRNEVIRRGSRLTMSGHRTRPLDVAWVSYVPETDEQANTKIVKTTRAFFGFPSH